MTTPETINLIVDLVAERFGESATMIKAVPEIKTRPLPVCRAIAAYLIRQRAGISFPDIAKQFNGCDHSTFVKGAQRIAELVERDGSVDCQTKRVKVRTLLSELDEQVAATEGRPCQQN